MRSSIFALAVWGVLLMLPSTAIAASKPFTKQAFTEVSQSFQGKKWLMLMWSLDCPPCFKELSLVGEMLKAKQSLNVVLINVDGDNSLDNEKAEVIKQFGLSTVTQLNFQEGLEQKSRYQIDPNWHGELPRSYFFEESGKANAKSGLVSKKLLQHWLL